MKWSHSLEYSFYLCFLDMHAWTYTYCKHAICITELLLLLRCIKFNKLIRFMVIDHLSHPRFISAWKCTGRKAVIKRFIQISIWEQKGKHLKSLLFCLAFHHSLLKRLIMELERCLLGCREFLRGDCLFSSWCSLNLFNYARWICLLFTLTLVNMMIVINCECY